MNKQIQIKPKKWNNIVESLSNSLPFSVLSLGKNNKQVSGVVMSILTQKQFLPP